MKPADPWRRAAVLLLGLSLAVGSALAARISDVRGTKHNLSAAPDAASYTYIDPVTRQPTTGNVPARTVKANTETQVCVFCHTPHGATAAVPPLWNRQLSTATYTTYSSSTLDIQQIAAGQLGQPNGSSKLCLSCHDGTVAIGNVNVLNGAVSPTIAMTGTGTGGVMPSGAGDSSGFTRKIGTDLTNDHPISFDFTEAVARRDGELRLLDATTQRFPADGSVIGVRAPGFKPRLPLEPTGTGGVGQMQCGTCHDPHLRETDPALGNQKFLRQNRFQTTDPTTLTTAGYTPNADIICVGCHDKNRKNTDATISGVWAFSAHASQAVANETYNTTAAGLREFPASLPVWQAACLNCHDTHTVQGSRRLLREGTDGAGSPKQGGASAIEETCYQCHRESAATALTASGVNTQVPDIRSDFQLVRRMPITTLDQGAGAEAHQITAAADAGSFDCVSGVDAGCGADFVESRSTLGAGNLANRHAECTDCHNPHRVMKGQLGAPGSLTAANTNQKAGTHRHEDAAGYVHSNLISGVLRGTFGVEPSYPNNSFHSMPSSFLVKRGDPGIDACTTAATCDPGTKTYVTREYQICLKCHSNYAYNDDNAYPNSLTRPQLTGAGGRTASDANGHANFTSYTNQAKEFQAPSTHAVTNGSVSLGFDGGAGASAATAATNNNNHRSWHPVMRPTGRTTRQAAGFRAPWNNAGALGSQTMYCSDCHGSATTGETAMPTGNTATVEDGAPWGPHGSANNFLLKGDYSTATGSGQQATGLCFKCHNYNSYAVKGGTTGFTTGRGDGHDIHSDRIRGTGIRCNFCHVAVPHGWKNRNLLVNLDDVGPEAGLAAGTSVTVTNNQGYTNGPYYRRAFLRVISFPAGQWQEANCNGGSKNTMITQCGTPN